MKIIEIQKNNCTPMYKQIVVSIEVAISTGLLKKESKLPSINKVCIAHSLSRDTVLQAYNLLKKRGIIYSVLGQGYFVKSTAIKIKHRVFLLFDELNNFKEDLYNSFLESVKDEAEVAIFFHHFNSKVFEKLVEDSIGNYTKYIIMPTYLREATSILKALPVQDVIILDQTHAELSVYPAVFQNFVMDIYLGLKKVKYRLDAYQKMVLIFQGHREPIGMKQGFENFCKEFAFEYEIISEIKNREISKGEVYVIPNDRDLVAVIQQANLQNLQMGTDFGILSYNETQLKKIIGNGITTISTDFEAMGSILAQMLFSGKKEQIENKSILWIRNSL